jgi:ribosomal-protein-alanine N-acetyltransferase
MLWLQRCVIRPWKDDDVESLVESADDLRIWRNLRDHFPHPYTRDDAVRWLGAVAQEVMPTQFAIEVDGKASGGIGVAVQPDVFRHSAEIGYWLGVGHWGRGIATEAVCAVSDWAFTRLNVTRLFAGVFDWNPASARVLEKAGYSLEGRLRGAVVKGGHSMDQFIYARLASDPPPAGPPRPPLPL